MSYSAADLLEQAIDLLERAAVLPFSVLDDEQLCATIVRAEQAGRLVDAVRAISAAEVDHRSRFELGSDGLAFRLGARRGIHLVEKLTRVSQAEAARRIRLGGAISPRCTLDGRQLLAEHPHVAAAVISGFMGVDAASTVIRALDQAARHHPDPADLDAAEQDLTAESAHETADCIAVMARAWRDALDPDGSVPREDMLRAQRGFTLGRERNGMTPFWGACDPVSAAGLKAAFAESNAPDAGPRFLSEDDLAAAAATATATTIDGDVVERIRDPRTREQRQLDVLLGLVGAGLSSGTAGQPHRSTTTVMAVVQLHDLETARGVGWLDDVAEPVSAATIRELACDSGFRRILLGTEGEVLAEGRRERYFTAAQRRALAVRDGGCVWPQCTAPPTWCHAHHVTEWSEGGRTDVDNGALLCPAHHHMLHQSPFTMKMVNGRPRLLAPPWLDPSQEWRTVGSPRIRGRQLPRAA